MKASLEFNLPEEREELDAALKGSLYKARIDELYDQVFRPHLKYDKPIIGADPKWQELSEEQRSVIEALWKKVAEHFEDVIE
jgi:TRAP-type C4-dicarboxylate transport system substrate-binding protein